jgi:hypothetical protein
MLGRVQIDSLCALGYRHLAVSLYRPTCLPDPRTQIALHSMGVIVAQPSDTKRGQPCLEAV